MLSALLIFWGFYWATDEWLNEPDRKRVEVTAVGPTPDAVTLVLNQDGQVEYQGTELSDETLSALLEHHNQVGSPVEIQVSNDTLTGNLVAVLDKVNQKGLTVRVITMDGKDRDSHNHP